MANYPQDSVKPYDDERSKSCQVEAMFDAIAPGYDRMNRTMSFWIDRRWRSLAIKHLKQFAPRSVLDIATGTGDFAIEAFKVLSPERVVAVDISEKMMAIGRDKAQRLGLSGMITFKKEDTLALTFADEVFDAITVAFGIRNFEDLDRGLSEMFRVLKPGGHLAILELSTPERFPFKQFYDLYSSLVIPALGKLMSSDKRAYVYLPASIRSFPQGEAMKSIIAKAGFAGVEARPLTFGACTLYTAAKK